ncbi:MAG: phosphoesterase [Acidobacteria bacterium]|nr:MAG: phosphoesterase [Acidobacteriota bacterium]
MSTRLYYDDSYLRQFEAAIVRVEVRGNRQAVWLDRTGFYPTSGGQPADTGTLDAVPVAGVEVDEADDVVHLVDAPEPLDPGRLVRGAVNWARRFDHMQQHTGQHVLSAAFDRLYGVRTIAFHMGAETATIDLAREMTAAELTAAEAEANRIVWEDRPVKVRYVTSEDAETLPLRKEPTRDGIFSACGGTHVNRTGAIGVIAINGSARCKGGLRVEFVCGGRALSRFRQLRDRSGEAARLLSVLPEEVPTAVERLQSQGREQRRLVADLQSELTAFRAEALVHTARPVSSGQLVLQVVDADAPGLKGVAASVVSRAGVIVALVSRSQPTLLVVARSSDVSVSAHDIVGRLTREFGGRGGGKSDLAQAGGLQASPEAILERAGQIIAAV